MVIISKPLFDAKFAPTINCKNIFHPEIDSCVEANLKLPLYFITGIFYFYLPLYLLKLLLDYKKINKKYLPAYAKAFLKSECYGFSFASLILSSVCLIYNVAGRIPYYCILIPGFVGGLSILFETPANRVLNTLIWSSMVIESILNNAYWFKILNYSPIKETFLFMLVNSLLMHQLANKDKKKTPPGIWFYTPKRCPKNECLLKNYLGETLKYFGIGYGFNTARQLISRAANLRKNPVQVIYQSILNKKNLQFGMVLGAYAGLYKGILHFLEKYRKNSKTNVSIAGFLAGISFYIKPTTSILTFAVVTSLQLLCNDFLTKSRIKKMPFTVLVYMISNGILFFNRIIIPDTCPRYYTNMLKIASKGLIDQVYVRIITSYLST